MTIEDIKGRLLLELYTHWCQGRFGGYQQPTPTVLGAFENYLRGTILNDSPSTDPIHEAWKSYQVGKATPEPEREVLPFEPEPEKPGRSRPPLADREPRS